MNQTNLDSDLETLRRSLHAIDDDKINAVQKRRNARSVMKNYDEQYNFLRLLTAMGEGTASTRAPYEKAISDRIAEQVGRPARPGFVFVPVPTRAERRDLTAANAGGGGYLVGSDVAPGGLFVHYLDESLQLTKLGISRMTLQRPATIPRISGTISTYWLPDEGTQLTESQFVFVSAASTPKTVGSYCEVSRHFLSQTSADALTFVMRAAARATAAEVTRKVLTGAGANGELDGLLGYPGIGTIDAASMNLSTCLDAVEDIETAAGLVNADTMAFVLDPAAARKARGRERATGSGLLMERNALAGFPTQVSSGLTANTGLVGDWSQLCLMEYSILEVGLDPFGASSALFKRGAVGLRTLWSIDSLILNPASFVELTNLS